MRILFGELEVQPTLTKVGQETEESVANEPSCFVVFFVEGQYVKIFYLNSWPDELLANHLKIRKKNLVNSIVLLPSFFRK